MKRFLRAMIVVLAAVMSLATNCAPQPPDPPDPPAEKKVIVDAAYDMNEAGGTVTLTMDMKEAWTITISGGGTWCTISQKSGDKGSYSIVIDVKGNETYAPRSCEIIINSAHTTGKIVINQEQLDVLTADPLHIDVPADGGSYTPQITANVDYTITLSDEWIEWADGTLTVAPNEAEEPRSAIVTLKGEGLTCQIAVAQEGIEVPPEPRDELDGIVATLRTHTEGKGIPVVIMGDAFSHELIEDGTYAGLMDKAVEAFFSIEPFTTYESLFDVYSVTVVSPYWEDFSTPGSTTLGTYFGGGSYITGDHDKAQEYALLAIPEEELDNTLVIILLNRQYHAGRCWMTLVRNDGSTEEIDDCTRGIAFAYMALGTDDKDFTGLVRHEAGGHGMGRLADEYYFEASGPAPQQTITEYQTVQKMFHAYLNVDFTSDPEAVRWAHFLQDERYKQDDVGVFEGAATWQTGVWRPSETSIMLSNEGVFNAPSREAIYYRIHKLSYGMEWVYDYETFVEYDAVNRTTNLDDPDPNPDPNPDPEPEPNQAPRRNRGILQPPCPPPGILPAVRN